MMSFNAYWCSACMFVCASMCVMLMEARMFDSLGLELGELMILATERSLVPVAT